MTGCALWSFRVFLLGSCLTGAWLHQAVAAPPTVSNLSLRGLSLSQPTTIVIDGADLLPNPQLILPVKIVAQTVKPGATVNHVELDITLDPAGQPGIYLLRVASGKGVSTAMPIGIDKLPQAVFGPQIAALPVALHGNLAGPQVQKTAFTGKKGHIVTLDCEAQRIGSNLKPVVRLFNEKGAQLAWGAPKQALGGDARCQMELPADGVYSIEVHDQLYRAGGPAYFRLKVGAVQYANMAFPLGASLGAKTPLKFIDGNLTTGAELDASAATVPGERAAPLPAGDAFTGAAPRVIVSDFPELVETAAPAGQFQSLPKAPSAVSGILSAPGEEDKYLLEVTPGQNLRFDVLANRAGSPVDGLLSIQNEQGAQLAANDDRPTTCDPGLDFAVPANVNKLRIAFKDMQSRGGADSIYRIEITDLGRPDFELAITTDRLHLSAGAIQIIPVEIERRNYGGAIQLLVEGLPAEVKVENAVVAPGATLALLSLTAPAASNAAGVVKIVGKALESPTPLVRVARTTDALGAKYQPQFLDEIGFALAEPAPLQLVWVAKPEDQLLLGAKLAGKVQLVRQPNTPGNIRLRLVSSQPPPQKKAEPAPPPKRRRGQSIPIATVDDLDRSLRLEGMPVFGPDKAEADVNILIPGDLPAHPWDLAIVAELLAADNQTVLASVATPIRTLKTAVPFTLELTSAPKIEGKAGAGDTGKFTGKLNRLGGFNLPVTITLAGLPKEYPAPQVVVPGDKNEFALSVSFPYGSQPIELKDVKLVAVSDPAKPDAVRSNELLVSVNVVPGEKPKGEMPKEIFEDDEKFIAMLNEGGGQITLETADKFSGKAAAKVTLDQRFSAKLPLLGVKIRENPAPGEYRFIRFAWKKKGGTAICLQINHDGVWGPGGTAKAGAKFRYSAGPAVDVFSASLTVDPKLPEGFVVVTRDLFTDFGEFTMDGIAFSPVDGEYGLYDGLYLGRSAADFELIKP